MCGRPRVVLTSGSLATKWAATSRARWPRAVDLLRRAGMTVGEPVIVPDGAEQVRDALTAVLDAGPRLVVTSGGTGVTPRDQTPEGTRSLLVTELPGLSEAIRRAGQEHVPTPV